jgi:hypothetical protein
MVYSTIKKGTTDCWIGSRGKVSTWRIRVDVQYVFN